MGIKFPKRWALFRDFISKGRDSTLYITDYFQQIYLREKT